MCPAARINVSKVCEDVESIDVKISANLTHLICDNLQNLSHVNSTFIIQALEFTLRKKYELPLNIVRALLNQVNGEELINALEEFNKKTVNSSLISNQAKAAIMRALWDETLRNEERFNETTFVTSWFQKRLRPFISAISPEILQCLHNETMQCEQYQAIVKGLDAEFMKMNPHIQYEVFHSFQLPYLRGLNASGSACTKDLNSTSWLLVNFARFSQYAKYEEFLSLNSRFSGNILPNSTKTALLAGVWPSVVSSSKETEVSLWLDSRLAHSFMFLNGDILNASETLNTSCETFQKIVNKLNENIVMFKDKEEKMYFSIKAYLTASKSRPRCYNASNPEKSNWLAMYLGNYIRYSSARDMRLLTNNSAAIFQDLAFNRDNLELINRNKIRKDLAEMYATALFTLDSDFNLDSLPDQLICFAQHSTLISSLSPAEALSFIARVNHHCSSSKPSASDRQLAYMLVAQVKTFDKQTLIALGQQAVGLTTGQMSDLTAEDLTDHKVLESLGQVKGWNRGQFQILVNKILLNYKVNLVTSHF
ncbi:uncharacterized protein LOC120320300 [Crotalus tigris]|uniref:uncharacterized protein LOC120320300 n=1 Tax=Crotalus tigris TaxID=88082 RepID=UPI00192F3783|nr:uncharacterized protein LOC120320300 [Crotalus tigris]